MESGKHSTPPPGHGSSKGTRKGLLLAYELAVIVPTLGGLGVLVAIEPSVLDVALIVWTLIVGAVELLPQPAWREVQLSVAFPLLMVVTFLYEPPAAALAALVGSMDPREYKRTTGPARALFNRCQIALSVLAAGYIFHSLADLETSRVVVLMGAAVMAVAGDYLVNSTFVATAIAIRVGQSPLWVFREMRFGKLAEFLISYVGLGTFGLFLAKYFSIPGVGFWSVPIFVVPLLLARQMFFRSKALEEAHKELQDREKVLRALSNRMAEERQDERAQIAAYLHDDLAQLLFKISLQVDIAERHLGSGKVEDAAKTLEEIKETKAMTSDRIRALIRDLHRSPLGRAGLGEALRGFIVEAARDVEVHFRTDIDEIQLPPSIALLLYHIAREGVMNVLKHAHATHVWLSVKESGDHVELVLRDDGVGFDAQAPGPEGHYGLTMMRERALVGGGTFAAESAPGEGTTITVRFPTSWLQPEETPQGGAGSVLEGTPLEGAPVDRSLRMASGAYPGSLPPPTEAPPESARA
jgi:signal transduction histidine kinase